MALLLPFNLIFRGERSPQRRLERGCQRSSSPRAARGFPEASLAGRPASGMGSVQASATPWPLLTERLLRDRPGLHGLRPSPQL